MKRLFVTIALTALTILPIAAQTAPPPYKNPQLKAEQRADDLLKRLTLEEKVRLMMDTSPAIDRLQIPTFQWWNEALHGVGRNGYATVFPITMAMAASWDDALLHRVFTAVSDEARVKAQQAKQSRSIRRYQSLSFWTPNINIFRDPRWGRGQETYGEDPFLTSRMGLAVVRGLQGMTYDGQWIGDYKKLLACAKHFAVHSGPEWNRHTFNVEDLPDFVDYTMKNRTYRYFTGEPLFPFGHGLSYTTFEMRNLKVEPTVDGRRESQKGNDGSLKVSVTVKNTGKSDGTETVQVYFRRTADTEGPLKTLCGYQQVSLKAGEKRVVTITLPRQRLETWDAQTNTMRFLAGQYQLMAGPSSADATLLKTNIKL